MTSAGALTEVYASAKDATTSEASGACTANCIEGIPESQSSGWRPVWLTAKLGRKTPKVERQERMGGGARHHRRVHRDSEPVSLFSVSTFVWGLLHLESCKLSCGFTSAFWSGFRCPEVPMSQYCDSGFEMSRGSNVPCH